MKNKIVTGLQKRNPALVLKISTQINPNRGWFLKRVQSGDSLSMGVLSLFPVGRMFKALNDVFYIVQMITGK